MYFSKIKFEFSFFVIIALISYNDSSGASVISLLSCALHELGHLLFMYIFKAPPGRIVFYAGGIKIAGDLELLSVNKRLIVLLGGCAVNLVACFVSLLFISNIYAGLIFSVNLFLFILNLLPIGEFDGKKITEELLIKHFSYKNYNKLIKLLNFITSLCLIIFLIVCCLKAGTIINISLAYTVLYMLLSEITG